MAGVSIKVGGDFTKLDELKNKAERTAGSIKSAFNSRMGRAAFAGLAAAGTAAFAAIAASMKMAIEEGGKLSDLMARTGASGEGLMVLQQALKNSGMEASAAAKFLGLTQKAIAGINEDSKATAPSFARLGLQVEKLRAMDPVDAFRTIGKALMEIEDPADRAAEAIKIFGRSGAETLVLFSDTSAFEKAKTQLGGLPKTLADNAAELDRVSDSMGLLQIKMQQMGAEVAVALLPELLKFSDWVNELDLGEIGSAIGTIASKVSDLAGFLGQVSKYAPLMVIFNKLAELSMPEITAEEVQAEVERINEKYGPKTGVAPGGGAMTAAPITQEEIEAEVEKTAQAEEKAAEAVEKAAEAAEKKAQSDRESAEARERSRKAAVEEYNIDAQILAAKIRGEDEVAASLEREKKIRDEMRKLESAGFSSEEARAPAERLVDMQAKLAEQEAAKKAQEALRRDQIAQAEEQFANAQDASDNNRFESMVGAVSSMQRIGGGGGAVSSGLDYQRQSVELQRQLLAATQNLASVIAGTVPLED
jgi:hypothetical protein